MSRPLHLQVVAVSVVMLTGACIAQSDAADPKLRRKYEVTAGKASSFLLNKGRASDGSYSSFTGTGITSMATTALLKYGISAKEPRIVQTLAYLKKHIQKDGGVYSEGSLYRNYETCLAILCFTEANQDGEYDAILKRADAFIKGIQWDETEGKEEGDPAFGGAGYGKHKRPDLSNT